MKKEHEKKKSDYFWQGDLVRLRHFREEDAERKVEELYDSEARSYLQDGITDFPAPTVEQYKKYFKTDQAEQSDDNLHKPFMFAIENSDGEFVGWINVWQRNPRSGVFEYGIGIFREFRKKGYAADAIRIILRYGFYELRMQKCNAACRDDNEASVRLHKSLGFKEEGRIRREIFTNDRFYDLLRFGLLKEEFKG